MKREELVNPCTCEKCKSFCRRRVCWATPAEARAIIEAGMAMRMMLDYWCSDEKVKEDILIVSPAKVGYGGRVCPFDPLGRCVFLTGEDLCELHDLDLKPREGGCVSCENKDNPHEEIAMMWNSEEGKEVVKLWRNKIMVGSVLPRLRVSWSSPLIA